MVVVLRDLQGWSGAEVAAFLGVAEGTVKSRLHRGREALAPLVRRRLEPAAAAGGMS